MKEFSSGKKKFFRKIILKQEGSINVVFSLWYVIKDQILFITFHINFYVHFLHKVGIKHQLINLHNNIDKNSWKQIEKDSNKF